MKTGLWICCAVALALVTGSVIWADEKTEATPALKCPVTGGEASKDATADYKGGKVYFCCAGCLPKFEKNTEKYATAANEQLVASGQAKQIGCPISGNKTDASTELKIDGIAVTFCCHGCEGKVKKADAAGQRELVFGKGFDKAFKVGK